MLVAAVVSLVLAGCSTNSGPKSYADQTLTDNYIDACLEANPATKDLPDTTTFCQCTYKAVQTALTFDEFKALDKQLREALADRETAPKNATDIAAINQKYAGAVDGCRTSGPAAPASNTTTTVATTTTTK